MSEDGMEIGTVVTCTVAQLMHAVWHYQTGGEPGEMAGVVELRVKCNQGRVVVLRDDETARVEGG